MVQLPALQPVTLLTLTGSIPAGASSGSLPYDIPLPANFFGAYDVEFTLTITDSSNGVVFDQSSTTISIN